MYMSGWASQVVLVIKKPPADPGDVRDVGLIPGSGRSPGGGHSNPLQCSFLENPMDRGAWRATVHKVAKSQTRLKHLSTQAQMNGCSFVPVKLYQQKQAGGQIWLKTRSLLTPTLKHYTNMSHPWSRSGNAGHKLEAQKPMRGPLLSLTSSSVTLPASLCSSHTASLLLFKQTCTLLPQGLCTRCSLPGVFVLWALLWAYGLITFCLLHHSQLWVRASLNTLSKCTAHTRVSISSSSLPCLLSLCGPHHHQKTLSFY